MRLSYFRVVDYMTLWIKISFQSYLKKTTTYLSKIDNEFHKLIQINHLSSLSILSILSYSRIESSLWLYSKSGCKFSLFSKEFTD